MKKLIMLMACCFSLAAFAQVPSESLYNLTAPMEGHDAVKTELSVFNGKPVIVTMFYSSCAYACPIIISSIRRIENQLSPEARAELRVVLVSMDPKKDTPENMAKLLKGHGADPARWKLMRPVNEADVADVAALLGMTNRAKPEGGFSHSAEITLLDRSGVVAAKLDAPGDDSTELRAAIERLARGQMRSKFAAR